jgi:secreted trypsin-like serine protease
MIVSCCCYFVFFVQAFGGTSAAVEQLPFFGAISAQLPGCDSIQQCSAVIVAKKFVLTASHCLMYQAKQLSDCVGTNWIDDDE